MPGDCLSDCQYMDLEFLNIRFIFLFIFFFFYKTRSKHFNSELMGIVKSWYLMPSEGLAYDRGFVWHHSKPSAVLLFAGGGRFMASERCPSPADVGTSIARLFGCWWGFFSC